MNYRCLANSPCTQMAICFSAEMKIEKQEKKKFNTNVLLYVFFIQVTRKENLKFLFNCF